MPSRPWIVMYLIAAGFFANLAFHADSLVMVGAWVISALGYGGMAVHWLRRRQYLRRWLVGAGLLRDLAFRFPVGMFAVSAVDGTLIFRHDVPPDDNALTVFLIMIAKEDAALAEALAPGYTLGVPVVQFGFHPDTHEVYRFAGVGSARRDPDTGVSIAGPTSVECPPKRRWFEWWRRAEDVPVRLASHEELTEAILRLVPSKLFPPS